MTKSTKNTSSDGTGTVGPMGPVTSVPQDSNNPAIYGQQNPMPTGGDVADYQYIQSYGVPLGYKPPGSAYSGRMEAGLPVDFYNLDADPLKELSGMNDVSRLRVVRILESRGWYGGAKAGDGLRDQDVAAFRDLLAYSNRRGMAWQDAINDVSRQPAVQSSSRPMVQVASRVDLNEIANRVSLETMGRTMSRDELNQFATAYQGVQRKGAYASEAAPAADAYFKSRIEKQYGTETDAYKHLTAISNVAKLLENI